MTTYLEKLQAKSRVRYKLHILLSDVGLEISQPHLLKKVDFKKVNVAAKEKEDKKPMERPKTEYTNIRSAYGIYNDMLIDQNREELERRKAG